MSVTAVVRGVELHLHKKHYTYRAQFACSSLSGYTTITASGYEDGVLVKAAEGSKGESTGDAATAVIFDPEKQFPVACEQIRQQTTLAVNLTMIKLHDFGTSNERQEIKKYEQLVILQNEGEEKTITVTFGEVGSVRFRAKAMFTLRYQQEKAGFAGCNLVPEIGGGAAAKRRPDSPPVTEGPTDSSHMPPRRFQITEKKKHAEAGAAHGPATGDDKNSATPPPLSAAKNDHSNNEAKPQPQKEDVDENTSTTTHSDKKTTTTTAAFLAG